MTAIPFKLATTWLRSTFSAMPAFAFFLSAGLIGLLLTHFLVEARHQTRVAAEAASRDEVTILAKQVEISLRRVKATSALLANKLADVDWATLRAPGPANLQVELTALHADFPEITVVSVSFPRFFV